MEQLLGDDGVADRRHKSTDLPLEPLRRLWANGRPMRLYRKGRDAALFSSKTPTTQRVLEQLMAAGAVELLDDEFCRLTEEGRCRLFESEAPRELLEDLLRVAEAAEERLEALEASCRAERETLAHLARDASRVLDRLSDRMRREQMALFEMELAREQAEGSAGATTLAQFYARLRQRIPTLTIGQFHDAIRALHAAGALELSPWTGPLYQLPEPALALLIGHEVLFYVRHARSQAA